MAAVLRSSVLRSSAVRVAAPKPSVARLAVVRRATEGENAPKPGTIMYGGKTYTEAEYEAAIQSGEINKAAPSAFPFVAAGPTFNDVMGFSGTVPERVNGRLAMLGFVAALGAELSSGESVLKQIGEEPTGIIITFLLFIAASLIPAFQNKNDDKLGPFNPAAELLNGRAAMIGFAALLVTEAVRGGVPLF